MKNAAALALCTLLSGCLSPVPEATERTTHALVSSPKKVAYYPIWTSSGDDLVASFPQAPSAVPWTKLTHINISFVVIDTSWQCAFRDSAEQTVAQNLISYRNANHPGVKILLAVGGWSDSYRFSEAFMNSTNRTAFVNSCVSLVSSTGADGIDLDWEYPTSLGDTNCPSGHTCQRTADKANLILGLDQFRAHAGFAGKLLTAAIAANGSTSWYDYPNFFGGSPVRFDWINVMTYDFHGSWESTVNFTAPYDEATAAMNFLLSNGISSANKHRVVMGIPFYGPSWRNVASPGTPGTSAGTFLGSVSYRKAKALLAANPGQCSVVTTGNNRHIWCGSVTINGTVRSNVWISYEDPFVVGNKGDFVANSDWGGMMWWSQGEDTDPSDLVTVIDSKLTPAGPPSWTSQDIGAVATPGSWTFNSMTGVHTVVGNGADIWNTVDEFRFVYQTLSGDGNITARLTNFTGTGTINANAKAGVMIRQDLTPGSPHLLSCLPVNGQTTLIKQIRRLTPTTASASTTGNAPTFPRWVRVTRAGTTLSTWESTDGTTWNQVGANQTIATLGPTTFVGLAVTSHTDGTNYTATFDNVTVNPAVMNNPPTVATGAAATPSPVPGTTTALSALGADDAGEAALTYTWSTTGSPPAPVTFSANGTNAAKNSTATFTKAGSYNVQVVIRDAGNLTVTSSVSVTVSQTLTSIVVAPASAIVTTGGTQQFAATARDQFATALAMQPGFTWTVSGGGTIDASGLFTSDTVGGPFTVSAASGAISGTAQVTVTLPNQPPTVATPAAATPSPTLGTTTALSVLGADDAGEAALTYTWSTTGTPPASVTFSANGTNAAKNTVATFTTAGDYSFQVQIKDAGNLTVTSSVSVTVVPTLTSIVVTPATASVVTGNTQQFTATARDQFATALTMQPGFTWMVSGGGAINASGLFTATTVGGPFTVTATNSGVNGTAQVTVTSAAPNPPSNLTATTAGGGSVTLTWVDNSSNETGFRVERKVNGGSYSTLTSVGAGVQTAPDATTAAGNTYTYRVIATGSPDSAPSNAAVVVLRGMEADALVRGGTNGTLNYGASTTLEAKTNSSPPENNRQFFVRFTLTDVQATVNSAKVRIFGNANTAAKTIAIAGVSNITWVEGTGTGQAVAGITYNNKPAAGAQITSQSVGITPGFWEFDITSYVQAQKTAGATKISLAVTQTTVSPDGPTVFSSKENATAANRPLVLISSK